jgi:hypothetical protein
MTRFGNGGPRGGSVGEILTRPRGYSKLIASTALTGISVYSRRMRRGEMIYYRGEGEIWIKNEMNSALKEAFFVVVVVVVVVVSPHNQATIQTFHPLFPHTTRPDGFVVY